MKRIVLLGIFTSFFMTACAQDDAPNTEIPSVVLNAFESEFGNPVKTDWETKGEDYEVEFELQNIEHTALMSNTGEVLKYKKDITEAELPEEIKAVLQREFSDKKFDDFELLMIDTVGYYQFEIEGTFRDKDMIFTSTGEMASEVSVWD
ncbi:hypothetical protein NE848_15715 [Gramella jeungdoensis]|uniref:Beta-lactamase-inhibitor-like PepSY-like domain-containing protein n=1 Tax=Gramella jeungdoensis TaxID=708091 RepID=A0ABT0Z543_9FLAO|nr:hypothetical protein [Gramella jeungdoensis]MCM8570844.1 hypothetical protein [Gramella jeungdoensis]